MRNFNLIAGLARRHEIHLLCFLPPGAASKDAGPLRAKCTALHILPQPRRTIAQRLGTTLTSPLPDMAHRLACDAFRRRLEQVLQTDTFDVIEMEGIEMTPYLSTILSATRHTSPSPRIVFDDHNAEYVLQQRIFETDIRRPLRWPGAIYSWIQWKKLERYEARVCRSVDAVAAVSEQDAAALQRIVPGLQATIVPNGVDIGYYQDFACDENPLPPRSLVFTGKMDFRPNVDAVLWFAQEVLPLVRQRVPDVHFYIVGQSPHRRLAPLDQQPAITITGRVPDTRPYIAGAAVYVIPLRSGGGTRLKVLEAMAMKKPIVSTSMGCDGYPLVAGREAVLADEPGRFADEVVSLLENRERCQALAEAGFTFAKRYDWAQIVPRLETLYT